MYMIICALLGFAVILAASFIRKIPDKFEDFCIGVSIPVLVCLLLPIGAATGWLRPATLDVFFRRADMSLGLDGFALTRWLLRTGWYVLVSPIYSALPLVLALGWALERSRTLLRAAVIGAVLAIPLYLLLPAAGPEYAFSNFPDPNSVAVSIGWVHPRNCFPSMHLTWAILVAWNLRNPRWRWLFVFYAALMALATVACGEHYFVDILAALPFAVVVQKIAVAWPSNGYFLHNHGKRKCCQDIHEIMLAACHSCKRHECRVKNKQPTPSWIAEIPGHQNRPGQMHRRKTIARVNPSDGDCNAIR